MLIANQGRDSIYNIGKYGKIGVVERRICIWSEGNDWSYTVIGTYKSETRAREVFQAIENELMTADEGVNGLYLPEE